MERKNLFSKSVVTGLIIGFATTAVIVNAAVTNIFSSGDPIVAAEVNTNFSDLDARIAALEARNSLSGQAGRMAYMWLSDPTPVDGHVASPTYSYNSAGGSNPVTQTGTGNYEVTFSGMEPTGDSGGHVQVTPYSSPGITCRVNRWITTGTDVEVSVSCFNGSGNLVNTRFTALFIR